MGGIHRGELEGGDGAGVELEGGDVRVWVVIFLVFVLVFRLDLFRFDCCFCLASVEKAQVAHLVAGKYERLFRGWMKTKRVYSLRGNFDSCS